MKKLITIFKSRFRKPESHPEILKRRELCGLCPYNSKNTTRRTFKTRVYKVLSDLFTWLTMTESVDLGQCVHPACGCDIYFKTAELEDEKCPKNMWSIYKPNSGQINSKQFKKWAK